MTEEYPVGIVSGNYYAEQNTKRVPVLHRVKRGIVTNNFRSLFLGSFDIRAGATLYRTTILKQYQFDENLSRYEDAKVEFDILRSNKVAITPDYLLVYSKDFSGLSIASGKLEKDFISCMVFENKSFWEKCYSVDCWQREFKFIRIELLNCELCIKLISNGCIWLCSWGCSMLCWIDYMNIDA